MEEILFLDLKLSSALQDNDAHLKVLLQLIVHLIIKTDHIKEYV
jgi:hypothetical protein